MKILIISLLISFSAFSQIQEVNQGEMISATKFNELVQELNQLKNAQTIVSGIEQAIGSFDGETVYRYCNTVASDVETSVNGYETIAQNLQPVEMINHNSDYWRMTDVISDSSSRALIDYRQSTGEINLIVTSWKIGAGTRYCMKYTKP